MNNSRNGKNCLIIEKFFIRPKPARDVLLPKTPKTVGIFFFFFFFSFLHSFFKNCLISYIDRDISEHFSDEYVIIRYYSTDNMFFYLVFTYSCYVTYVVYRILWIYTQKLDSLYNCVDYL